MNLLTLLKLLFSKKSLIIFSVFLFFCQGLIIYYLNSKLDNCRIQNTNNLKIIENLQNDLKSSNEFLELNKKQCSRLIYDLDNIDFAFSNFPKSQTSLDTSNKPLDKSQTIEKSKNFKDSRVTIDNSENLQGLKEIKNLMESIK